MYKLRPFLHLHQFQLMNFQFVWLAALASLKLPFHTFVGGISFGAGVRFGGHFGFGVFLVDLAAVAAALVAGCPLSRQLRFQKPHVQSISVGVARPELLEWGF
jgi:fucose permease